jgi:hypothetical protein
MSPEKQRIAIAQACRWKDCDINWLRKPALLLGSKPTFSDGEIISYLVDQTIPYYPSDLNAMHEAEKVLTQDQMIDYSRHVGKAVTSHLPASRAAWMDFKLINATAAQKSKAFLQTLGLLTESPTQPQ